MGWIKRSIVLLVVAAATAAPASAAGLPPAGILVPGRSLGGLQLGSTPTQVEAAWGRAYGVCHNCRLRTWYFNLNGFRPQGAGVEFRRGRADAIFTLWSPAGWQDRKGLHIGDTAARITELHGPLVTRNCGRYTALELPSRRALTVFYVLDGKLWGFGLLARTATVCR